MLPETDELFLCIHIWTKFMTRAVLKDACKFSRIDDETINTYESNIRVIYIRITVVTVGATPVKQSNQS